MAGFRLLARKRVRKSTQGLAAGTLAQRTPSTGLRAAALGVALAAVAALAGVGAVPAEEAGTRLIPVEAAFDPAVEAVPGGEVPVIIPVPQRAEFPDGLLPLKGVYLRVVGGNPELQHAALSLRDELASRWGVEVGGAGPEILIGTVQDEELAGRVRQAGIRLDGAEAYALHVGPQGAWVAGAGARGAYWGVQTLLQLVAKGPDGPVLRFADIVDWPAFAVRAAMIYLDAYSEGVNDRLIPILARHKFNQVLVMANYVQWDSTRQIWHPQGAGKDEARRVAGLIRRYGMEPVPLIELLGHAQWMFYGGANRDLLQDPGCPEPFAYDPLNPRTYEVVLPVLDEAIEVFRPRYVHIGHDEVRNRCTFPATEEGRRAGFNTLFYNDVMRLYEHLRSRGVGTMMWQDVAFSEVTRDIVGRLPKDIVITDWHYWPADDFPSVREIRAAGFPVIGATWYRPGNAESFARSALRDGAIGMLQTRWTGYFGNPSVADGQTEQAVAYIRAAASFWNPDAPVSEEVAARRFADEWVQPRTLAGQPGLHAARQAWRPVSGRLVYLGPHATRSLVDPDGSGWLGKGPEYDLSALVEEAEEAAQETGMAAGPDGQQASGADVPAGRVVRLGPYAFHLSGAVVTRANRGAARDLPETVTIPIHAEAAALAVLHAAGWAAPGKRQSVGTYTLTYQDGTTHTRRLSYGREIAAWTDPTLNSLARYPAWRGHTRNGLPIGLDVLEIENPYPNKMIASFTVKSDVRWTNPVVVGLTLLDAVSGRSVPAAGGGPK
ncbi:MAG: glycoside hydrolase family 20 zincin-like fold domain-containing protein [Bacillota bacterium]